ncbi:putative DD41D transposase [Trichonephila clavipes]|nr:putative DD41D transposase [Trichonephila clavipes]
MEALLNQYSASQNRTEYNNRLDVAQRFSNCRVPQPRRRDNPSCQVIYSQFGLAIHQNDHQAKRRFVEWAQNEIAVVPDFHKRILFSDEAHFWLNGYINKQNCRIWSEANPQVYVETPLHPEQLTVWCVCGLVKSFFKNDEGHNVTVNGDRYRAMITNFFIPELNNHDVQQLWFQQDGATCHTARATIDLLNDTFGDRLISRFGPVNWPPRSCDLTPLNYFLWGYVKSLIYADNPQTLDYLEDNIRRVIADIRPQMLEKVIENWTSRLDYIRASHGSHMPEIIFKIFLSSRRPVWYPLCRANKKNHLTEFSCFQDEGQEHKVSSFFLSRNRDFVTRTILWVGRYVSPFSREEFERGCDIGLKERVKQIEESLVIWFEAMRPLEDAGKNGLTIADIGAIIVAVDLGPHQIRRTN